MFTPSPILHPALVVLLFFLAPSARAGLVSVQLASPSGLSISGIVDTAADPFQIDSWVVSAGGFRTPEAGQLPFTLPAFTLTGDRFDVPDHWMGAIGATAGWAFLLPVGQGVEGIAWVEGPPSLVFNHSSFGWGGFRNSSGRNILRGSADTFAYVPALNGASDARLTSIVVRPIPEPSTALFGIALGLCGAACGRPRRRARRAASEPALAFTR